MSVIPVTRDTFHREVLNTPGRVLVEFWADWAPPSPTLEQMVRENKLGLFRVNADREPELANRFAIRRLPTLLVLRDGQEAGRFTAPCGLEELLKL